MCEYRSFQRECSPCSRYVEAHQPQFSVVHSCMQYGNVPVFGKNSQLRPTCSDNPPGSTTAVLTGHPQIMTPAMETLRAFSCRACHLRELSAQEECPRICRDTKLQKHHLPWTATSFPPSRPGDDAPRHIHVFARLVQDPSPALPGSPDILWHDSANEEPVGERAGSVHVLRPADQNRGIPNCRHDRLEGQYQ